MRQILEGKGKEEKREKLLDRAGRLDKKLKRIASRLVHGLPANFVRSRERERERVQSAGRFKLEEDEKEPRRKIKGFFPTKKNEFKENLSTE